MPNYSGGGATTGPTALRPHSQNIVSADTMCVTSASIKFVLQNVGLNKSINSTERQTIFCMPKSSAQPERDLSSVTQWPMHQSFIQPAFTKLCGNPSNFCKLQIFGLSCRYCVIKLFQRETFITRLYLLRELRTLQ